MRYLLICLWASLLTPSLIADNEVSFKEMWLKVKTHSPDLSVAQHEKKAAEIAHTTAEKHWYPRLYLESRGYGTNDPALSFISVLSQRRIASSDFSPNSLNYPPSRLFIRGTLGIDMPIYQGGSATAQEKATFKFFQAKSWEEKSQEVAQYADVAETYAELLVLAKQEREVEGLVNFVVELIKRYQIGGEGNPVGYSGLLGMKSLRNRLLGIKEKNAARQIYLKNKIALMSGELPSDWVPLEKEPIAFVERWVPKVTADSGTGPLTVKAARSGAEASENKVEVERGKLLPQVGLFVEGNALTGNRATGTSYAGGAYLKWDLFSAPSWGELDSSRELAAAARARAEAITQKSAIILAEAQGTEEGLRKNILLLAESASLLEAQIKTARQLFQNGSVNALQLVEVLSRRADLISQQSDVEMNLAKVRTQSLAFAGDKIPEGVDP